MAETIDPTLPGTYHGTTVAIGNIAVLLRGPTGSGKSDLALRLIDSGGKLVADDRTVLSAEGKRLIASSPATLRGKLEVRGLGIVEVEHQETARVGLVVDLTPLNEIERMPEDAAFEHNGVTVKRVQLCAFEASVQAKIRIALQSLNTVG